MYEQPLHSSFLRKSFLLLLLELNSVLALNVQLPFYDALISNAATLVFASINVALNEIEYEVDRLE